MVRVELQSLNSEKEQFLVDKVQDYPCQGSDERSRN